MSTCSLTITLNYLPLISTSYNHNEFKYVVYSFCYSRLNRLTQWFTHIILGFYMASHFSVFYLPCFVFIYFSFFFFHVLYLFWFRTFYFYSSWGLTLGTSLNYLFSPICPHMISHNTQYLIYFMFSIQ